MCYFSPRELMYNSILHVCACARVRVCVCIRGCDAKADIILLDSRLLMRETGPRLFCGHAELAGEDEGLAHDSKNTVVMTTKEVLLRIPLSQNKTELSNRSENVSDILSSRKL